MIPNWGKEVLLVNEKSKKILKLEFKDMNDTIITMAESMIDLGMIPDKRKK